MGNNRGSILSSKLCFSFSFSYFVTNLFFMYPILKIINFLIFWWFGVCTNKWFRVLNIRLLVYIRIVAEWLDILSSIFSTFSSELGWLRLLLEFISGEIALCVCSRFTELVLSSVPEWAIIDDEIGVCKVNEQGRWNWRLQSIINSSILLYHLF